MLGIDISCAQCHDHPFDEWTQGDFYEMAAFFGNTQRSLGYRPASAMMGAASVRTPSDPGPSAGRARSGGETMAAVPVAPSHG